MVYHLQQVSKTGQLTTLVVSSLASGNGGLLSAVFPYHNMTLISSLAYGSTVMLTVVVIILIGLSED